ncbi:21234_t:CDS:1, partial [Dentiscutata erythropus]
DLIAYPTEPPKITSIDTEHKRKDKPLSNKSEVQTIQFPMETAPTPPCIETENTMCNIEIESQDNF